VNVELNDGGAAPDVRLVLTRSMEVLVTITAESGEPVGGASILPQGDLTRPGALMFSMLTTDGSGTARVRLPPDLERLGGVVLPPGYAFQAFDVALERGRPVNVVVTRFGGTLRLQLPSPPAGQDWARALVGWQDSNLFPASLLFEWAQVMGVRVDWRGTRFTIPQVAPGEYRLCIVSVSRFFEGGPEYEGQGGTCADGFLPRLGELPLTLQPL
jgi:hypothetical protein